MLDQCTKSFHNRLIINNISVFRNYTVYTADKVSLNRILKWRTVSRYYGYLNVYFTNKMFIFTADVSSS
jgi:hypothetical protein